MSLADQTAVRATRRYVIIIVTAGIPRSGSTWLFNAVRSLAELRTETIYTAWAGEYDRRHDADITIVKIHEPDPDIVARSTKILVSHRDLRDIAASATAMHWATNPDEILAYADNARRYHEFWAEHAVVNIAYRDISERPLDILDVIAKALDWSTSFDQLEAVMSGIPNRPALAARQRYDPVTLLHPNHVTDGRPGRWRDQLPPSISNEIWRRHSDWLDRYGYSS